MTEPACVYIVDDNEAICESMCWLMENIGLKTYSFTDPELFLHEINPQKTSCILLDMRLPKLSGLKIQEKLNERRITAPVVFMTGFQDMNAAVDAMKAGAFDLLTKPFGEQQLIDTVQLAVKSHQKHNKQKNNFEEIYKKYQKLSAREKQVLFSISRGMQNKKIAEHFGLSCKTIEVHRLNMMRKMKMKSIAEVVRAVILLQGMGEVLEP